MAEVHNRFIKLPAKAKLEGSALKFAVPKPSTIVRYTNRQGHPCSVDLKTPCEKLTGDALDAALIHYFAFVPDSKPRSTQIKR